MVHKKFMNIIFIPRIAYRYDHTAQKVSQTAHLNTAISSKAHKLPHSYFNIVERTETIFFYSKYA